MRIVTNEKAEVVTPKPYRKPTLIKGPVLSSVTAAQTVSGIPSDEFNPI